MVYFLLMFNAILALSRAELHKGSYMPSVSI